MTAVQCPFYRAILYALLYGAAGPLSLLVGPTALSQTCGAMGSPYGLSGCIVPGQYGNPSVRIKADPLNPGGFRSTPVSPPPNFSRPLPPGLDRDYSLPPGIR